MEFFSWLFSLLQLFFVNPVTNLLVAFYQLFSIFYLPYAFAFSIIALTLAIRFILYPLTAAQIRSAKKMQELAPKIAQIKERYKSDRTKQQQEIMKVYRESGINPASGCLPLLVQIPIIWSLYHVLTTLLAEGGSQAVSHINSLVYFDFLKIQNIVWDPTFFEISLSAIPRDSFVQQPLFVLVSVITAALQFVLSRMMMPAQEDTNKKKKKGDDFQAVFQKQMMYVFPFMIAWLSFVFPLGLALYWNTFTLFGILQQYKLAGLGGLEKTISRFKK